MADIVLWIYLPSFNGSSLYCHWLMEESPARSLHRSRQSLERLIVPPRTLSFPLFSGSSVPLKLHNGSKQHQVVKAFVRRTCAVYGSAWACLILTGKRASIFNIFGCPRTPFGTSPIGLQCILRSRVLVCITTCTTSTKETGCGLRAGCTS